jgi:drug/metabolite transporter (DMT)-like permease
VSAVEGSTHPSAARIWVALSIVYTVWSTTYLAIRVVNETLPPLLAAGVRFVVAGALLYAWSVRRGDRYGDRPGARQWRAAAIVAAGLVAFGNGFVALGERTVPTGITALLIALVPLWMALIDRAVLRHRIRPRVVVGLVLGFGGAGLLIGGNALRGGASVSGMLVVVVASLSWASGSLYSRNAPLPRRPLVGAGMEFLCGGVMLLVLGTALGELGDVHLETLSRASAIALVYLITIGSWVAFASYLWLLRNARTSLVSTYAYVNPALAVALGTVFLNESISAREVVAGAVILAAVALIISAGGATRDDAGDSGGDEGRSEPEREVLLQGVRGAEQDPLAEDGRGELEPDREPG